MAMNWDYDTTLLARMAGNIAAGTMSSVDWDSTDLHHIARMSVLIARKIIDEVNRTEPKLHPSLPPIPDVGNYWP